MCSISLYIAYKCYTIAIYIFVVKGVQVTNNKRIIYIDKRIAQIQKSISQIGDMRPGSLTMQYKDPKNKKGGYYQISYTYKMKSRTEYVKPQFVQSIENQVKSYKKFKSLIEEWIDLAIEKSKLLMISEE